MKAIDYQDISQSFLNKIKEGAFLIVQAGDRANVMTIGWALLGYIWRKPVMMVAVRKTRFTFTIIEDGDSFAVSVPTGDMAKEIQFCGTKSGRDFNKFEECNLQKLEPQKISSPMLAIPGYHFECRIIFKSPMDPKFLADDLEHIYPEKDYHTLYFGEILACWSRD